MLVTNKELREIGNNSRLFQADVTDGNSRCRLIAWGPVGTFFNNKIFVGSTYKCTNLSIRKTPPQYTKQDYIPYDLTLTSGAQIEITHTPIREPNITFLAIADLTKYINKRVNTFGVIIDYDKDVTATVTSKGDTVSRRSLEIADYHNKVKVTLWANTAESTILKIGSAVYIKNSLVKIYGSEVSISCDKIQYADENDSEAKELIAWHAHPQPVEPLIATRRRLSYESHITVQLDDLQDLNIDTTVRVQATIENIHHEDYNACDHCKTEVITMDGEYFCPKCTKTVHTTQRSVFALELFSFEDDVMLFHDNSPTLLDITAFQKATQEKKQDMLQQCANKTYTLLILKRINNKTQATQYVALDFEELPP